MTRRLVLGWREWASLPELGVAAIKVKVDTGARTSALHAFYLEPYWERGALWIRFGVHPLRRTTQVIVECRAEVVDRRVVSDSGGHREMRYCIATPIRLGGMQWPIEITLTNRDSMLFRMLLGRTAIGGRALVDPASSYLLGKPKTNPQG